MQPRASSLNFDAVSSSKVGDVLRDHETVLALYRAIDDLEPDFVPGCEELLQERPDCAVPPIDARIECRALDQSKTASGAQTSSIPSRSWRLNASLPRRTISTFSCDIARAVSRSGRGGAE